jgi:protein TonB
MHLTDARVATCFIALLLAACGGGPSVIRDPAPVEATTTLAEARDDHLFAAIDRVIVPNAKGAWAQDAKWDEYIVSVRAVEGSVRVKEISIFDALGTRVEPRATRGELIDATREVEQRYKNSPSLTMSSAGSWVVTGAAIAGGAAVIAVGGAASAVGAYGAAMSGAAAGAAAAPAILVLGGLAMAGYGVARIVDNVRVGNELERRRTKLPLTLDSRASAKIDVFFPVTPIPTRAEITYSDARGEDRRLRIDTQAAMALAHAPPPVDPRVFAPEPEFPVQASLARLESGSVRARLTVDGRGRPRKIEVIESSHPAVFDEAAVRTLRRWRYVASDLDERVFEAQVEFKR